MTQLNQTTQATLVLRWRRLATAMAATTLVLSTTFFGLPAYAAEPAAAPMLAPVDPPVYTRFEHIGWRWALNIGFTQGDKSAGADALIWSWQNPYDSNSQWLRQVRGDGYITYRNRWSNMCLGVESLWLAAPVEQQVCDGTQMGQLWTEIDLGTINGRPAYMLRNKGASFSWGKDLFMKVDTPSLGEGVHLMPMMKGYENHFRWYKSFVRGA
jgi:hypothetical protein